MTSNSFGPTKTAAVNGITLAYHEEGEGEPFVFVHGGVSDLRTWEHQLPVIGRSYRAVAYSRRFHQPNQGLPRGARDEWGAHADDLAAFLREIDASPAHLVGNSQGAYISLVAAMRYPEVVHSLVLEEPPALPLFVSTPPRLFELLRLFAIRPRTAIAILRFGAGMVVPIEKMFRRGENEKALETFVRGVLGKDAFAEISEARVQQARENLGPLRAFVIRGDPLPPLPDGDVRAIQAPALLLKGERSNPVLHRLLDRLGELLPNVERMEIPRASHLMHEDDPSVVNEAILAFLRGHSG